MSHTEKIRSYVATLPEGEPFTTVQFLGFASRATVDQALARLARAGVITRLSRGVYLRPKHSRHVGAVMPEPHKLAEAVARATGANVQVHGAEAARRFELSTQVPTQPVFYTSGPSRRLRLGKLTVELRHVSPRKVLMAERPAGIALTALWYLGKEQVTPEVIDKIRRKLPEAEFEALRRAAPHMPGWMAESLRRSEMGRSHG